MDPINKADENELQKAINNITGDPATDAASNITAAPEGAPAPEMLGGPTPQLTPTMGSNDSDLSKVKSMALSDLRPILENVEMPPESKFKLYKDIIEVTQDKATIEPAYTAAKAITSDKERAEALLYIIETIDRLGA